MSGHDELHRGLSPLDQPAPFTDQLRLAVAACLARVKGSSREHTKPDLRSFLTWCAERGGCTGLFWEDGRGWQIGRRYELAFCWRRECSAGFILVW